MRIILWITSSASSSKPKNLFRDYKTQSSVIVEGDDHSCYRYEPKFFDMGSIFNDYDWDEENFSLMKAQHLISLMLGFNKWSDIPKASEAELKLARLLFDNESKISLEEWEKYIVSTESDNATTFDAENRLEIFKQVVLNVEGHESNNEGHRLN